MSYRSSDGEWDDAQRLEVARVVSQRLPAMTTRASTWGYASRDVRWACIHNATSRWRRRRFG